MPKTRYEEIREDLLQPDIFQHILSYVEKPVTLLTVNKNLFLQVGPLLYRHLSVTTEESMDAAGPFSGGTERSSKSRAFVPLYPPNTIKDHLLSYTGTIRIRNDI